MLTVKALFGVVGVLLALAAPVSAANYPTTTLSLSTAYTVNQVLITAPAVTMPGTSTKCGATSTAGSCTYKFTPTSSVSVPTPALPGYDTTGTSIGLKFDTTGNLLAAVTQMPRCLFRVSYNVQMTLGAKNQNVALQLTISDGIAGGPRCPTMSAGYGYGYFADYINQFSAVPSLLWNTPYYFDVNNATNSYAKFGYTALPATIAWATPASGSNVNNYHAISVDARLNPTFGLSVTGTSITGTPSLITAYQVGQAFYLIELQDPQHTAFSTLVYAYIGTYGPPQLAGTDYENNVHYGHYKTDFTAYTRAGGFNCGGGASGPQTCAFSQDSVSWLAGFSISSTSGAITVPSASGLTHVTVPTDVPFPLGSSDDLAYTAAPLYVNVNNGYSTAYPAYVYSDQNPQATIWALSPVPRNPSNTGFSAFVHNLQSTIHIAFDLPLESAYGGSNTATVYDIYYGIDGECVYTAQPYSTNSASYIDSASYAGVWSDGCTHYTTDAYIGPFGASHTEAITDTFEASTVYRFFISAVSPQADPTAQTAGLTQQGAPIQTTATSGTAPSDPFDCATIVDASGSVNDVVVRFYAAANNTFGTGNSFDHYTVYWGPAGTNFNSLGALANSDAGDSQGSGVLSTYPAISVAGTYDFAVAVRNSAEEISNLTSACIIRDVDITSSISGDPQFVGFFGQSYQVHGIPNQIFNLITSTASQLNSRFAFIDAAAARGAATINKLRLKSESSDDEAFRLPATAPWTHPGTYLSELGFRLVPATTDAAAVQVYVAAGVYEEGFKSCVVMTNGSGVATELAIGQSIAVDDEQTVTRLSTHKMLVQTSVYSMVVTNSDNFFNLEQVMLQPEFRTEQTAEQMMQQVQFDGLLGRSASTKFEAKNDSPVEILKYLIQDNDIFSTEFVKNAFPKAVSVSVDEE